MAFNFTRSNPYEHAPGWRVGIKDMNPKSFLIKQKKKMDFEAKPTNNYEKATMYSYTLKNCPRKLLRKSNKILNS